MNAVSAACAEETFTIGGEGCVVSDLNGAVEAALQFGAEVEAIEAGEVGRMVEDAEGQFDGTGAANADADGIALVLLHELADGACHVVEDSLRAGVEAGGEMDGVEGFAVLGDGCDAEVGTAEIDANRIGIHESTMIREGGRAAASG